MLRVDVRVTLTVPSWYADRLGEEGFEALIRPDLDELLRIGEYEVVQSALYGEKE